MKFILHVFVLALALTSYNYAAARSPGGGIIAALTAKAKVNLRLQSHNLIHNFTKVSSYSDLPPLLPAYRRVPRFKTLVGHVFRHTIICTVVLGSEPRALFS